LADDYEILVVDDGSRDQTAAQVAEMARDNPRVRLLCHEENRGYGRALRTGFEAARCSRVAFTDADCQFHQADQARLLPLTDRADVAVGYRVARQDPWRRRFYSRGYNLLVRTLLGTGVRDCDCALKVFRKEALPALLPETTGFFVNAEMLTRARQQGYRVEEAGVRHRPRVRGTSTVSLWDIPRTLRRLLPFWWSQVLFPASGSVGPASCLPVSPAGRMPAPLAVVVVLLIAALLFFSRLRCPLQEPEEPRYAEIPRQMLAEGHWALPVLHGLPYYDKPPLLYWLVMASYQVLGVHDWAARLVPCTAGFFVVVLTYWWGRSAVNPRAALAGALILCLSGRYVYLGRMLTMNSLLCLWVVAGLATAHAAVRGPTLRWRWWLLSAVCCGLGLLTKGPVALALTAIPVLAYQALDARSVRLRWWPWATYVAVAAGLAAPWYVAMAVSDPAFARYFFWTHHVVRYVAPFDHEEPFWFYLPGLLLGMLPWTLLVPSFVKFLGRRSAAVAVQRPAALGFCLLAAGWCVVFYSAAGCKRAGYILPAMPPLALALGCYFDAILCSVAWPRLSVMSARRLGRLAYRSTVLVLAVGAVGGLLAEVAGVAHDGRGAALTGVAVAGSALLFVLGRIRRPAGAWGLCAAVTFVLLLTGVNQVLPGYAGRFSLRDQVKPHAAFVADQNVPVACYPRHWDSVSFYLRRGDVRAYTPDRHDHLRADLCKQSSTLVFVKSDHSLQDFLHLLPTSLEFVPRGRRGHVTVGLVRQRREPPDDLLARR
jgi:dolichol-phosphate mannosyltransferase